MLLSFVDPIFFLWFPFTFYLFSRFPKHRALIAAFVLGELFLPEIKMSKSFPDAPDPHVYGILKFTKNNVIGVSCFFAAFFFDRKRLLSFRPRWFDLPLLIFCMCPFWSDYLNGVAPYDSFAMMRDTCIVWVVPYVLGRVYFTDWDRFRELVIGIVLGGLLYVPFYLFETISYPPLHYRVYGFFQHDPNQMIRSGGYRPVVFMEHGLAVALWMASAALLTTWLWWSGAVQRIPYTLKGKTVTIFWAMLILIGVVIFSKSIGALSLCVLGFGALLAGRWIKMNFPVAMLVMLSLAPMYMFARTSGGWDGKNLVQLVTDLFGKERSASLKFRMDNENLLLRRAMQQPNLGWGDTGLARLVGSKEENDSVVTDGLWVITIGDYGVLGLVALYTAFLLQAIRFLFTYPQMRWAEPMLAAGSVAAVVLIVYMIDCLSNAMINPVFTMLSGALAGVVGVPLPATWKPAPVTVRLNPGPTNGPPPPRRVEPAIKRPPVIPVRRRSFSK